MINEKKIDAIRKDPPIKLADSLVLIALLIIAIAAFILTFSKKGAYVVISTPAGNYEYPLSQDREVSIKDGLIVKIEGGQVWVKSSDCPDKVCINTGKISKVNEMIVCVPYGVVITVTGDSDLSGVTG